MNTKYDDNGSCYIHLKNISPFLAGRIAQRAIAGYCQPVSGRS